MGFEEKVRRTVYVDNLSPQVTEPVLKTALEQFGSVKSVQFIPNLLVPENIPLCALVEMANPNQAHSVLSITSEFPFMVSGMPRPVRVRPAEPVMFSDRPANPTRSAIQCRWVDPDDPDFEVVRRLKNLASTHSAEAAFLLRQQLADEAQLATRQQDTLRGSYGKYEAVDSVMLDDTANKLRKRYGI